MQMIWDWTIKVTDIAIVLAAMIGPVLAVQVQVFLERRRAQTARRAHIFHMLMRTRAASLAPDHVQALNTIPLEFYGIQRITDAYKAYITHLGTPQTEIWGARRVDLFMDLLNKLAAQLGYQFDVVQLKSEFYAPQAHYTAEAEQEKIRQGLAKLLSGETALPLDVKSMPADPQMAAAMKGWLTGESVVRVVQVPTNHPGAAARSRE